MVEIRKATLADVEGIIRVCSEGYRHTYREWLPPHYIENTLKNFTTKIASNM